MNEFDFRSFPQKDDKTKRTESVIDPETNTRYFINRLAVAEPTPDGKAQYRWFLGKPMENLNNGSSQPVPQQ